jgi:hypothetical protein
VCVHMCVVGWAVLAHLHRWKGFPRRHSSQAAACFVAQALPGGAAAVSSRRSSSVVMAMAMGVAAGAAYISNWACTVATGVVWYCSLHSLNALAGGVPCSA